jgi:hypothetical protein
LGSVMVFEIVVGSRSVHPKRGGVEMVWAVERTGREKMVEVEGYLSLREWRRD